MAWANYSQIIEKHVIPSNEKNFWGKETKLLKKLMEIYPDRNFWQNTEFRPKLQSFAQLMVAPLNEVLRIKYRNFFIVFEKDEPIKLNKKKSGKDIIKNYKPSTIRNFLNG